MKPDAELNLSLGCWQNIFTKLLEQNKKQFDMTCAAFYGGLLFCNIVH